MRSKMRKLEVGKSKPTENREGNKDVSDVVGVWVTKVREAVKMREGDGTQSNTQRIADVLVDLLTQTNNGTVDREVISELVTRVNVIVPLEWAVAILK